MKVKKIITGMLLIAIFMTQINIIPFSDFVYAQATENVNSTKFHYQQLNDIAKKVYDGIYEMYEQGILKTGTESFDLAKDDKYVTQEQLENYMKGNTELKDAMNAARYAFYADYPEVFYVEFQKIKLRVTKDAQNRYHANMGSGNLKDYYVEGFTSKEQVEEEIIKFNNIVDEIAEGARNLEIQQGQTLVIEQIKYVHNQIINNTSYRVESDCTVGNESFIGTPYGALVRKQAVCEGYARALKTVLDKIGINCILVQGIHQSEGAAAVPHMWNYVEVEKRTASRSNEKVWYAVDATLDDPFLRKTPLTPDAFPNPGDDIEEGFENTRYCLVGTESYNNKGYAENVKDKKYILMKYHEYKPGDDIWREGNWGYMNPDLYVPGAFRDNGNHIYISVPNSEYVEFAVTTRAPSGTPLEQYTYQGDGSDFVAQSGKLYNPNGTYKAPPYIKTQSPAATASLSVGPTYHVDVTYDDDLVLAEGQTQAGYRLESTGPTGADHAEITNFTFDGKRRVTFDLKFSKMWADDGAGYSIYITGIVGKNSGKAPMEISYGAVNIIACSFSMNKYKNWEVYGTPTLLENEDLSMNEWETSDGEPVSEKLKSRIALVTTRTTSAEKDAINELMEEELGDQKLVTSETYNISLNVCKKYVVKTGHRLRISLGFPAGYGPEDAGVTFKAYHFMRDKEGNVTGVEEIPCVVTQYGLIITCDSFSPFAIAMVETDEEVVIKEKAVIVSAEEGGNIAGANREEGNIITLKENETETLNIKANEGYEIESITICGQEKDMAQIENKEETTVTVSYDDVKDGNCIVNVKFVAKTVLQVEESKGERVVEPEIIPATAKIPDERMASLNGTLTINSNIEETEGIVTYQWYKDGTKLEGKTNKVLTIENVKETDGGEYILKVTNTLGTLSEETSSNTCTVTVRGFATSITSANETVDIHKIEPGEEFELNFNIDNFKNIGKGLISLTGQLEYDTNILEKISITGKNGWDLDKNSFNEQNFKLAIDNEEYVTEGNTMFTVKFKAKDTITQNTKTIVKIKEVAASGGYGAILANDSELEIGIQIPEIENITSEKYDINEIEKDISKIAPETTVAQFKQNVTTKQEMVFTDKEGNTLNDERVLGTGMKVKVGETLEYTIVVTGDIDGDAKITVNDLAKIKLHIIEKELLSGISLKAADVDEDEKITVNDVARIKLILISLSETE